MVRWKRFVAMAMGVLVLVAGAGKDKANEAAEEAKDFIAEMDAKSPEDQYPNWKVTRARMMREAPKVGDPAPDFTLKTRDGSRTVQLSQVTGRKPVVLIFGSWT